MATKTKPKKKAKAKPKMRGGTSEKPTVQDWVDEARKIAEPNGSLSVEVNGVDVPIVPGEPIPEAVAEAVTGVIENAINNAQLDPAKAYDSPEALGVYDHDTAAEAEQRRRTITDFRDKLDAAKDNHKAAKAAHEESRTQFFDWLRERNEQRGKAPIPKMAPLFPSGDVDVDRPRLPIAPGADDLSWKLIPLKELVEKDGLPNYLEAKLANAARKDDRPQPPILTLGDLTDFQAPEQSGWTKKLTDLVGIGEGAMEKISEATGRFWDRWGNEAAARMDAAGEAEPEEPEDDDEDEDLDDDDEDDN